MQDDQPMEDRKQAIVIAAARRGRPGKSERRRREIPCLRQAGSLRKADRPARAGREEKIRITSLRMTTIKGSQKSQGAKPAPGAPSDSKTHPCKNQMRKDRAPSVSLYFGDQCCLAGCSTRFGRISPKQEGRAGEG